MARFLLFRLYGPLAAWGVPAVGELRPIQPHPSRSAILGLLGAALGVERNDAAAQSALADGYGIAVRVDSPGNLIEDYHTVQAPRARRNFDPATRRDELAVPFDQIETMVTRRGYVTDALAVVAVWARDGALHSLGALAEALRRPAFVLYLGRKSCPLSLPPVPVLSAADDLPSALAEADGHWAACDEILGARLDRLPRPGRRTELLWDDDLTPPPVEESRILRRRRRDQPADRGRWQFQERWEQAAVLEKTGGGPA